MCSLESQNMQQFYALLHGSQVPVTATDDSARLSLSPDVHHEYDSRDEEYTLCFE